MLGNSVTFASGAMRGGGGQGKGSHHTKGGVGSLLTTSHFEVGVGGGMGGGVGMGGSLSAGESQASFGANKRGGVGASGVGETGSKVPPHHVGGVPHKGGEHKGGMGSHNSVIQSHGHHHGSSGAPFTP